MPTEVNDSIPYTLLKPAQTETSVGNSKELRETQTSVWSNVCDFLKTSAAILWMGLAGFGPPWALVSVISALGVYLIPEQWRDAVSSDAYFYVTVIGCIIIAASRTAIIVKITFDRERRLRRLALEWEANSHRNSWWCNYGGLALSSIFVFGDGIGRIWALASATDATWFVHAGWPLFSNLIYFTICLGLACTVGILRLLWWTSYWFTFSQVDDVILSPATNFASSAETLNDSLLDRSQEWDAGNGVDSSNSRSPSLHSVSSESALRRYASSVYPLMARSLADRPRRIVKAFFRFPGGFGRTWATFALINTITMFVRKVTPEQSLLMSAAFFWTSLTLSTLGGLFTMFGLGGSRFKVFIHHGETLSLKRLGPPVPRKPRKKVNSNEHG